jgi:APA family basic amino acid/polyamine antiporter
LFLIAGVSYVRPENYRPFFVPTDARGRFGAKGVVEGSAVIFFAYVGFDAVSTAASEAIDPQRAVPIATLASLVVCTGFYVAVAYVLTGLVPYTQLDVPDPIAVAINAAGAGFAWVRPIIKIGAIAGLTSVVLVLINGQARIVHAMASDGLLPRALAVVDARTRTPSRALLGAGCAAAALAAIMPLDVLGEMVSIGTLAAFAFVCVGVLVLRRSRPDLPRPFRVPFAPAVPAAGALICVIQMATLPPETWLRLLLWMALGGAVWFFHGRLHALPIDERVKRLLGSGEGRALEGADTPAAAAATPRTRSGHAPLVDDDGW